MKLEDAWIDELTAMSNWANINVPNFTHTDLWQRYYRVMSNYWTNQPLTREQIDQAAYVWFDFASLKHQYKACNQHCLCCKMEKQ